MNERMLNAPTQFNLYNNPTTGFMLFFLIPFKSEREEFGSCQLESFKNLITAGTQIA